MPHKEDVAAAVDELDPAATALRSVNTVVPHRRRAADAGTAPTAPGSSLRSPRTASTSTDKRVCVLGAGGAARAIVDALGTRRRGGDHRRQPRRHERAKAAAALADGVGVVGGRRTTSPTATSWSTPRRSAWAPTSCRATRQLLHDGQVVADIVYHPLDTALLRRGRATGAHARSTGSACSSTRRSLQQQLWTGVAPRPGGDVGRGRAGVGIAARPVALTLMLRLPHRRRVARPGAGRDRRGPARRAADHGRGDPGRDGPAPARLRPRPAPEVRAGRADAARRRAPRPHARLAGRHRDQEHRVVPQRQVARGDVAGARASPRSR